MRTLMIMYRVVSFLIMSLSGLCIGAGLGWVVGNLIVGSAEPFFWFFSFGETAAMSIGATVGGGLGIYTTCVLDAELRHRP